MLLAPASSATVAHSPSGSTRQNKPFSWKLLFLGCFIAAAAAENQAEKTKPNTGGKRQSLTIVVLLGKHVRGLYSFPMS